MKKGNQRYNQTTQWFGNEDPHTTNTTGYYPEHPILTPYDLRLIFYSTLPTSICMLYLHT
jgi:hypothetical protein